MNSKGVGASIAYVVLLLCCAICGALEAFGMAFAIGESETTGIAANGFLLLTVLSVAGFLLAAAGAFAKGKFFDTVALISAIAFLPCSILFFRQWISSFGYQGSPIETAGGFGLVVDVAAGVWAWNRLRHHASEKAASTEAHS